MVTGLAPVFAFLVAMAAGMTTYMYTFERLDRVSFRMCFTNWS